MSDYISPLKDKLSFHCPHCNVLSKQTWVYDIKCFYNERMPNGQTGHYNFGIPNISVSKCTHCQGISFWLLENMIYPITGNVEVANKDLTEEIKSVYNEAKSIVSLSPKGASALLRLALQMLCKEIKAEGKTINDNIAYLVKKGLSPTIQKALDTIRVVGNNSVHPGLIDLDDKPETAYLLFKFINVIANHFITIPKEIEDSYNSILSDNDRENIEKRDS